MKICRECGLTRVLVTCTEDKLSLFRYRSSLLHKKEFIEMQHTMKLRPSPFKKIKNGEKTIELRLYDDKRRCIEIGDTIRFVNTENTNEVICAVVIALHIFESFEKLYERLPLLKCGYSMHDVASADASDMNEYYSLDEQRACGVVGIEIGLLSDENNGCEE